MTSQSYDLQPKDGRNSKVIRVARIGTLNQDEKSLDDQLELLRQTLPGSTTVRSSTSISPPYLFSLDHLIPVRQSAQNTDSAGQQCK